MSRLFRATDRSTGKTVVVKFPDPDLSRAPLVRAAFLREAWITTRLRGPWLGQAPEPDPGRQTRLYAVMTYYPGETLENRLNRQAAHRARGRPRHRRDARQGDLASLHRSGIIHRDIKPSNVMLQPDGVVRLIDFGLARVPGIEEDEPIDPAGVPGTPSYMAPELFAGSQPRRCRDGCLRPRRHALPHVQRRLLSLWREQELRAAAPDDADAARRATVRTCRRGST